jgi:hypothetical protein
VRFATITLCVASQQVFIVVVVVCCCRRRRCCCCLFRYRLSPEIFGYTHLYTIPTSLVLHVTGPYVSAVRLENLSVNFISISFISPWVIVH